MKGTNWPLKKLKPKEKLDTDSICSSHDTFFLSGGVMSQHRIFFIIFRCLPGDFFLGSRWWPKCTTLMHSFVYKHLDPCNGLTFLSSFTLRRRKQMREPNNYHLHIVRNYVYDCSKNYAYFCIQQAAHSTGWGCSATRSKEIWCASVRFKGLKQAVKRGYNVKCPLNTVALQRATLNYV